MSLKFTLHRLGVTENFVMLELEEALERILCALPTR